MNTPSSGPEPGRARPVLSLEHVGLSFRRKRGAFRWERFWALRDVSFDVLPGETLGVVGRNGAGKSTLLLVMAGILRPERGAFVNRGGRPSLLSLQAGFNPYLTGRENALLGGLTLGLRRREVADRLEAVIAFSELGDAIDHPLYTYSTGMTARLGFAVAFHADPDVLLIDEVLSAGDASFQKKSQAALRERILSDKTVVLVSHSSQVIRELCTRAVLIEDGRSVLVGETGAVLEAYLSPPRAPSARL